nr:hypothetical protein [Novosphingobium sp. Rr 2-17]
MRRSPVRPLVAAFARTCRSVGRYFSEAARPNTMVGIKGVKDGGYAGADEVFVIPEAYRAKD